MQKKRLRYCNHICTSDKKRIWDTRAVFNGKYAVVTVEDYFEMHFNNDVIFSVEVWNKLYHVSLIKERLFPEILLGEDAAWTPYIFSYVNKVCFLNKHLYEYDRSFREGTLGT